MTNSFICPKCYSTKSTYISTASWDIPWEPYKDANGKLHKHDPNKQFDDYKCECGHVFEIFSFPVCKCGWQAENP